MLPLPEKGVGEVWQETFATCGFSFLFSLEPPACLFVCPVCPSVRPSVWDADRGLYPAGVFGRGE